MGGGGRGRLPCHEWAYKGRDLSGRTILPTAPTWCAFHLLCASSFVELRWSCQIMWLLSITRLLVASRFGPRSNGGRMCVLATGSGLALCNVRLFCVFQFMLPLLINRTLCQFDLCQQVYLRSPYPYHLSFTLYHSLIVYMVCPVSNTAPSV